MATPPFTRCTVTYKQGHPVEGILHEKNYQAATENGDTEVWDCIMDRYVAKLEATNPALAETVERDREHFQLESVSS